MGSLRIGSREHGRPRRTRCCEQRARLAFATEAPGELGEIAVLGGQAPDRLVLILRVRARWGSPDDQHATASANLVDRATQPQSKKPGLALQAPASSTADHRGRHWTSEEEELLALHHALNPAQLARLLGRSDAAISRRLCGLGLRRRANRSPHHSVSRVGGEPTPGERVTIERELAADLPRRRIALARRLGYLPDRVLPRPPVRDPLVTAPLAETERGTAA